MEDITPGEEIQNSGFAVVCSRKDIWCQDGGALDRCCVQTAYQNRGKTYPLVLMLVNSSKNGLIMMRENSVETVMML